MMRSVQTVLLALLLFGIAPAYAQQSTGPQQLSFAGLRAVSSAGIPQGQINAVRADSLGNLYLLIDQKDGVRVLKTDPAASTILAQAQLGTKGDIGLAMALDPSGNVYVTGTTTSGALTATAGAAFLTPTGTTINSFVAKFDPSLNTFFITFAGSGSTSATSVAATSDAVFITGSIFSSSLPVTPSAIIQAPAFGSSGGNGFVEKFSSTGSTLLYATYLSGANGSTNPSAIAADASDNAYITGNTSAPGYPTLVALIPAITGTTSGFLTKLTPAGDGITFSTYIPGAGITSLALDPAANNLLLSGSVALGQFPVASVQTPLTALAYQTLLRMPLDGSTVLASTLLAPGSQSFVAAGTSGTAWVDGALTLPILPLTSLSNIGNSFAVRVNPANLVDQTARFGGLAATNPGNAGAPINLTSIAVDASGNALVAGSFAPYTSSNLLATQTFDLPLNNAPTTALPSIVHSAVLPSSACNGSLCAGSASFLAKLTTPTTPTSTIAALALSIDDSPNLTLRNLGSAQATGLTIASTGFTSATNCSTTLPAGEECSIALTGLGPGSITVQATNATPQTQTLPAFATGATPLPIVFSPKELDFGIVSSASVPTTRTITVTNLTTQSQTFTSALNISDKTTLPYTIAEQTSDCTPSGSTNKLLAPGASCHVTLALTASSTATNDGPIQQTWLIGTRSVQLTAYTQAAALSVSAPEIDFGTHYPTTPGLPRFLYLSNNSTIATPHAAATLPDTSPFSITDRCPVTLEPHTVCQLQLAYRATHTPSSDSVTLQLDQGLAVLVSGRSLPQPAANGASVNPNLNVSATSLNFVTPVIVTGISSSTQTLTIQNTGASPFTLTLALTGDFTDTTNCGPTLAGNATCTVLFTFTPSQPGTRQGLLAVTAGAGTTPAYITLTGAATPILSPGNNGTLNFGSALVGQPTVQWYKITQSFSSFAATTSFTTFGISFTAILVEDIGYGHGEPPASAFSVNPTGTCFNCWLGIRFTPTATGPEIGALTLTSAPTGNPYVLSLTGNGLPLIGLILTPAAQDFGPVPINSTSPTTLFTLTNLVPAGTSVTLATPILTGDFTLSPTPSGGATCGGTLAYTASCYLEVAFAPTAIGPRAGALTLQSGAASATATLTGYGSADPGLAINPTALIFQNVPGPTSTQQTITLTNTSIFSIQIGTPSIIPTTAFIQATTCATLAPAASCAISVTFTPATAPAAGTLTIPVTTTVGGNPVLTNFTIPLTATYTTENAGIEILANDGEYGPQSTGSTGITRQFTVNNLTTKSLTLNIALPRQFVLSGPPCSGLAPSASCNFSVVFLPLDNGDITGTLFAQATPTDGSATLNGISYVEGYGTGTAALSITGSLLPGSVLNFGQVPSGQSASQTLTFTNTSSALPLTIRRITSEWPFLATTTCGTTLTPGQSCTATLTYTPLNQVATGISSPPQLTDLGALVIESDAASSPDFIDLTGTSTPIALSSPSNTPPLSAFTASQSSLTFATTSAGNISAPQNVTLNNTGTATIHILGIQTTPDFTVSSSCANLLPAASCTLTVTFTPQVGTISTRISAIEISSDASTPLEFISLIGTAAPSSLGLSPANLTFGTVLVGSTATQPIQISNTGATPITFGALSATGDYSVALGSCSVPGVQLATGTSCSAQITFAPTQSGTRTGTFSVASSASTLPLTAPLIGTAVQSHLQITPSSLSFGSIAVGAPASLPFTLSNTGNAPITGLRTSIAGSNPADYAVTVPCTLTTLGPGDSCSVTATFTPAAVGARPASLIVTSSDSSSPATIPVTGTGVVNGTFSLTVNGGTTAFATVQSGSAASYNLTVTPANNFSGTVVLTCTPIAPAQYAFCSLLPSSVTITASAQNSVATINTVTSVAASQQLPGPSRSFSDTALCLFFPTLIFTWKARTSRHRAWRRIGPIAWAWVATVALLSSSGCGGGSSTPANSNLRYAAPGVYQYQVTASSINGATQITQSVPLNLTVQ